MLLSILKQHQLTGGISNKAYSLNDIQAKATDFGADAIVVSNPDTLERITGRATATLDAYRGSRFNFPVPVFIINPLEHIHTVPHGRWLLDRDFEKVKDCKKPAQKFQWKCADTLDGFSQLHSDAKSALMMAFDVETNPSYRLITCVSFAMLMPDMSIKVWLIPFIDFTRCHYASDTMYGSALAVYQTVMALPCPKIAHNANYDATYGITYNAEPNNLVLDTMIMGWARYSEIDRDLGFVSSLYLYDHCQWKHEADAASAAKDIMSYWAYCARDSWSTLRIMLQQLMLTDDSSYWVYNYRRTIRLIYPAIYCAFEGCLIDEPKRTELAKEARKDIDESERDLRIMADEPQFNIGSPLQVSRFLYDIIGATKPKTKSKTGTGIAALNRIAMQHPLIARIVDLILSRRKKAKLESTYFHFELLNGRALWSIDVSGTESGRMASKKSAWVVGLQIQNIPRKGLKDCFIPDPDFILVEIDKSKSEARIVAYSADCQKMIDALEDKEKDYYKVLFSMLFGIPYEEVTKDQRDKVMKRIIHGSNYLMEEETFIDTATPKELFNAMTLVKITHLSLKDFAKYLLELYHKPFPELRGKLYKEVFKEVRLTKHMTSVLGWTRRFFRMPIGYQAQKLLREAVAHLPQNLSVDLLNEDFWEDYLLVLKYCGLYRLKGQIHDSRFKQIHKSILIEALTELKRRDDNQKPIIIHGREMRIPSEIKISDKNWASMEVWNG